jgi:hypothetical protein
MSKGTLRQPENWVLLDPEEWPRYGLARTEIDRGAHPVIAAINRIAESAAGILGPLFWAALVALFIWAEISAA